MLTVWSNVLITVWTSIAEKGDTKKTISNAKTYPNHSPFCFQNASEWILKKSLFSFIFTLASAPTLPYLTQFWINVAQAIASIFIGGFSSCRYTVGLRKFMSNKNSFFRVKSIKNIDLNLVTEMGIVIYQMLSKHKFFLITQILELQMFN